MTHPLVGDLTGLSTDELNQKLNDLSKRINQAYRMGYSDACQQLQMIQHSYQYELQLRQEKLMQELAEKSGQFKNIIDIGH